MPAKKLPCLTETRQPDHQNAALCLLLAIRSHKAEEDADDEGPEGDECRREGARIFWWNGFLDDHDVLAATFSQLDVADCHHCAACGGFARFALDTAPREVCRAVGIALFCCPE